MVRLKALVKITKELEEVLNQPIITKNRESVIEQINLLIEKRGKLMDSVKPPFTEEEKVMGKKLIILNESIQLKMTEVLDVLKVEMKQLKKQKKSNQNYVNPYKDVRTMDGMFMDSKK
ncbi:flagellar protein FliT [Virgibacillus necropolis]|uniref:Flagellar protein FliT n=1 Tax=Virgibacillus necropolis TaxID=163877 RepID=A0A221MAT8_9BACI|nr:flagellar protein FliT [Virgibacillus necropolis]ASN04732.1 flagellar protein FliT [Virgibacillus necropolis]